MKTIPNTLSQAAQETLARAERRFGKVLLEDLYRENPVAACRRALRLTHGLSEGERIEVCDILLNTSGVEAINGEWQNGYWGNVVATYCNTGDTYNTTILCVRGECRFDPSSFIVTSWGDWVEKNSEKYGIN